jgi:hypothetical protein
MRLNATKGNRQHATEIYVQLWLNNVHMIATVNQSAALSTFVCPVKYFVTLSAISGYRKPSFWVYLFL